MLREASMIAIAPWPVPVPNETVPSYDIGHTRTRALCALENRSSAIPPKFIGSSADSDIFQKLKWTKTFKVIVHFIHPLTSFLWDVDIHIFAREAEVRPFPALHELGRRL